MRCFLTYIGSHKKTTGTFGGEFERNVEREVTESIFNYFKNQRCFKTRTEVPPKEEKVVKKILKKKEKVK